MARIVRAPEDYEEVAICNKAYPNGACHGKHDRWKAVEDLFTENGYCVENTGTVSILDETTDAYHMRLGKGRMKINIALW